MKKILRLFSLFLALLTFVSCTAENNGKDTAAQTDDVISDETEEPVPERIGTAWFTTPAIPADIGKTVNLSGYDVQFSLGVTTSCENIKWSSDERYIGQSRSNVVKLFMAG